MLYAIYLPHDRRFYTRHYETFDGHTASLAKNMRGQWCQPAHGRKAETWKTREGAERKAAQLREIGPKYYKRDYTGAEVVEVGPTDHEIRERRRERADDLVDALRAVVRHARANFDNDGDKAYRFGLSDHPEVGPAVALLNEIGEDDGRCPTCGEDGGTSCGSPTCGLLTA